MGVLAMLIAGMVLWLLVLHHSHGSVSFRCGLLSTANDPYLDGSGRVFQQVSWHLGNATRTRGETYGLKIHRCYLSMQVTHLNPRVTPAEAGEDQ
jgi:hypothetical protein